MLIEKKNKKNKTLSNHTNQLKSWQWRRRYKHCDSC